MGQQRAPKKSAALIAAAEHFIRAGLPLPFIPPTLQPDVQQLGEWLYGTRHDAMDISDMGWFAKEVATRPTADYVLMGWSGRGMQSNAFSYYLVAAPLAVFVQSSWGGVYSDEQAAVRRAERRFALVQRLYQAAQDAAAAGRIGPDERFIVLESDFSGGSWIRIAGLMEEEAFVRSPDWRMGKDALTRALAHLNG